MMSRANVLGATLLVILLAFVGGMAVLAHYLGRVEPVDPETLCPTDGGRAHTVVLIDRTDPLTEEHILLLADALERVTTSLGTDERLSLFLIEGSVAAVPEPIFSRCRPHDGSDVNPLYQNERLLQTAYEETFDKPLGAAVAKLDERVSAPTSPIMEMVRTVAALPSFRDAAGRRRMIIVSDLLQNVAAYSHYRTRPVYEEFRGSRHAAFALPSLHGVEVKLVYLPNHRAERRQGRAHLAFWKDYFTDAGASIVEVVSPPREGDDNGSS